MSGSGADDSVLLPRLLEDQEGLIVDPLCAIVVVIGVCVLRRQRKRERGAGKRKQGQMVGGDGD